MLAPQPLGLRLQSQGVMVSLAKEEWAFGLNPRFSQIQSAVRQLLAAELSIHWDQPLWQPRLATKRGAVHSFPGSSQRIPCSSLFSTSHNGAKSLLTGPRYMGGKQGRVKIPMKFL